jgi:hypothetical protein
MAIALGSLARAIAGMYHCHAESPVNRDDCGPLRRTTPHRFFLTCHGRDGTNGRAGFS